MEAGRLDIRLMFGEAEEALAIYDTIGHTLNGKRKPFVEAPTGAWTFAICQTKMGTLKGFSCFLRNNLACIS